jgi:hypothetical protein
MSTNKAQIYANNDISIQAFSASVKVALENRGYTVRSTAFDSHDDRDELTDFIATRGDEVLRYSHKHTKASPESYVTHEVFNAKDYLPLRLNRSSKQATDVRKLLQAPLELVDQLVFTATTGWATAPYSFCEVPGSAVRAWLEKLPPPSSKSLLETEKELGCRFEDLGDALFIYIPLDQLLPPVEKTLNY